MSEPPWYSILSNYIHLYPIGSYEYSDDTTIGVGKSNFMKQSHLSILKFPCFVVKIPIHPILVGQTPWIRMKPHDPTWFMFKSSFFHETPNVWCLNPPCFRPFFLVVSREWIGMGVAPFSHRFSTIFPPLVHHFPTIFSWWKSTHLHLCRHQQLSGAGHPQQHAAAIAVHKQILVEQQRHILGIGGSTD